MDIPSKIYEKVIFLYAFESVKVSECANPCLTESDFTPDARQPLSEDHKEITEHGRTVMMNFGAKLMIL